MRTVPLRQNMVMGMPAGVGRVFADILPDLSPLKLLKRLQSSLLSYCGILTEKPRLFNSLSPSPLVSMEI